MALARKAGMVSADSRSAMKHGTQSVPGEGAPVDSVHPIVVFIYPHNVGVCHAVRKNVDGQWSKERVAFCGWQAPVGPVGFLARPDGGLCRFCAEHCSPHGEGADVVWRAKTAHADPLGERLAKKLFEQVGWRLAHGSNQWVAVREKEQLLWIAIARLAIENHPVAAPYSEDYGHDD